MKYGKKMILVISIMAVASVSIGSTDTYKMYTIPSWGDQVCSYPGTDPGMDSAEAMTNMIKHWKGRGYTGVHMRTDLAQIEPLIHRNPTKTQENPRLAVLWKQIDEAMESYAVHVTGQRLSNAEDFEFWAWHTHLFSDGAPEDAGSPGEGRMWPWSYCAKYTYEHPEVTTIDRKGRQYWMVREYAYPGARSAKVDEFVHMAKQFGLKRFVACMRSEGSQVQPSPDKGDQFGFNEPVVNDMKRLFGVDIMTDPRLDVDNPRFDPREPMVENWHKLRGTYFTQLIRELRESLREVDPDIKLAITVSGERIGPPMGNWVLDWRTWVDEGLIDEIITPVGFHASTDARDDAHKGYLDDGHIPFTIFRDYIKNSKHPDIKVISTGGPPDGYFLAPPPEGADGWRMGEWGNAYPLAWYQRWQQWKKDLKDFGHIKFFEQDFDNFPVNNIGHAGGWGALCHNPTLRACPGVWNTLGNGSDSKPVAQQSIKHGDKGNAIKLTHGADGSTSFAGFHNSASDRSAYYLTADNAITNGVATFEYWLYRDGDDSSVLVYFQDEPTDKDVGLRVASKNGRVLYSDGGKWVESDYCMPVGQWQKLTIKLDTDKAGYSAYAGANNEVSLCSNIGYTVPKTKYVDAFWGGAEKLAIKPLKAFKQMIFITEGKANSVTYLDDVSVKWVPTLYYTEPSENVYFADNFESHKTDGGINGLKATGGRWQAFPNKDSAYFVDNDVSFGEGVKSLHATGGGVDLLAVDTARMKLGTKAIVTVDFDVFVRSDRSVPDTLPHPNTKSKHRTAISLDKGASGLHIAGVFAGNGTWQYWDGDKYVDSKLIIAYDVWNHFQMALDTSSGLYKIVLQPLGEMPIFVGQAKFGAEIKPDEQMFLCISPSDTPKHLSCYDNILITQID